MHLKKLLIASVLASSVFSLQLVSEKASTEASESVFSLNTSSDLGIFRDLSTAEIKSYYSGLEKGSSKDDLLEDLQQILKKGQVKLTYSSGDTTSSSWNGYYLLERDWEKSPLTQSEITSQKYNKTDIWTNILYSASSIYIEDKINSGTFGYEENGEYKTTTYKNNSSQFDREHVLPKSFGFNGANDRYKDLTAGCDMQNLHAGEHNGNSKGHSNYPYGTVVTKNSSTAIKSGITGEIIGYTGNNSSGIKVFEPLDEDKGDIARTIFYMCARYHTYEELGNNDNTPAITLSNSANAISTLDPEDTKTNPAAYGELDDLLAWNKLDPVSEFEVHRNNLCYNAVQHNRNPFIDYPAWADVCYGDTSTGIDLSNETGVIGGVSDVTSDSLKVTSSVSNIYKNTKFDTANLTAKFNDENISLASLKNTISLNGTEIKDADISNYVFTKSGNYIIKFEYVDSESNKHTFELDLTVMPEYLIKIDNLDEITTKVEVGSKIDMSKLAVNLYKASDPVASISNYTIVIYDSDNTEVSRDMNYEFSETGRYKVNVKYEYDGDILETSFDVKVTPSLQMYLIYGSIALAIIIIAIALIVYYNKKNKKKRKNRRRKR